MAHGGCIPYVADWWLAAVSRQLVLWSTNDVPILNSICCFQNTTNDEITVRTIRTIRRANVAGQAQDTAELQFSATQRNSARSRIPTYLS